MTLHMGGFNFSTAKTLSSSGLDSTFDVEVIVWISISFPIQTQSVSYLVSHRIGKQIPAHLYKWDNEVTFLIFPSKVFGFLISTTVLKFTRLLVVKTICHCCAPQAQISLDSLFSLSHWAV